MFLRPHDNGQWLPISQTPTNEECADLCGPHKPDPGFRVAGTGFQPNTGKACVRCSKTRKGTPRMTVLSLGGFSLVPQGSCLGLYR